MIEKNGKNLEWVQSRSYQEMNLNWYQNSTQPTIIINFIYPAPAPQKQ